MNKEELLKAIEQKRQEIWPTDTGEMKPATVPNNLESGWLNALYWMENLINSLPSEQPSEEVNKEIDRFIADKVGKTITVGQVAHYFAKWQKEQLMKSATNGCYIKRNKYTKQNVLNGLSVTCEAIQKFRDGDKVKVIIIKEDEQ